MSRKSQLAKSQSSPKYATPQQVVSVVQQQLSLYSGPLPQADQLERYEQIQPGFSMEILEMAKKDQNHSIEMAKRAQEHSQLIELESIQIQKITMARHQRLFGRGQIIGGVIALSGIVSGTVIAISGSPVTGGTIIGSIMAVLTGAFAWGKWHDSSDGNSGTSN